MGMQLQRAEWLNRTDRIQPPRPAGLFGVLDPLLALTELVSTTLGEANPLGVRCPSPGRLEVEAGPQGAMAAVTLRYGLELAWLVGLPALRPSTAAVLAARVAGLFARLHGVEDDGTQLFSLAAGLATQSADLRWLGSAALTLAPTFSGDADLTAADVALCEALWPLAAPGELLLASGGDDRLVLESTTGLNRYGCAPWPRPETIAFSSCTASSLSVQAFAATEQARRSLVAAAVRTAPSVALAEASDEIGGALLEHFGVADLAEAVLAASGTDAALVVTGLLATEQPGCRLTSILMSPSETGSGVPDAVQGRHFASSSAAGFKVGKGQTIEGMVRGADLVTVALRDSTGAPRGMAEVAAECDAAIRAGVAQGRVVLHAIDGSKTGLTAPDRATCQRLARAYGNRLDIVVDACQARIEPALARWYLRRGFPILVTGSKFYGAPGFCGAVLFPRERLQRIARRGGLPAGLAPYARMEGGFGSRRCPGLVLRWQAALHQMRAFACLPVSEVRNRLDRTGGDVTRVLGLDKRLKLVDAPRPRGFGWSGRRSVFTFTIEAAGRLLSPADLRIIYRALGADCSDRVGPGQRWLAAQPCRIGQPVELGAPDRGALRVAISAGQVVAGGDHLDAVSVIIGKLSLLLDGGIAAPGAGSFDASQDGRMPATRALLTG